MKIDLRDNCFISQGAMIMSDSFVRTDADVQAKRQTDWLQIDLIESEYDY